MSSDSDISSTLGSSSRSGELGNDCSGYLFGKGGVQMEVVPETMED